VAEMIDIHCHILYGLDDGAKDLNESLEMAKIAYDDGVRHMIATPHCNMTMLNYKEIVLAKVLELQAALDEAGIQVQIHPGAEFMLENKSFFDEHYSKGSFHPLGKSDKFILLEQRWDGYVPCTLEVLEFLKERGVKAIVPHPERHWFFRENPQLLISLIEAGAWTQVSVDSLLGKNNEDARKFSEWMVEQDLLHTLATDAHNVTRRPNLSLGYERVRQLAGEARIREIAGRAEEILQMVP
jgi:protein-tyrosine phosphatase